MRPQRTSRYERQAPLARVTVLAVVALSLAGCQPSAPSNPPSSAPTSTPTTPSTAPASGGATSTNGLPAELVEMVEQLIRLNDQYCELAKKVQDSTTFRQNADELSRLDQEASSVTEDIMIAEGKLDATQKATLDRELFAPRAQPSIERKRQEKQRVTGFAM